MSDFNGGVRLGLSSDLLPRLGGLTAGSRSALSPFDTSDAQLPTPGELEAAGIVDQQGRVLPALRPVLDALANPSAMVNLQVVTGGALRQWIVYYGQVASPPVVVANAGEGVVLECPLQRAAIIDAVLDVCSDSGLASFDLDVRLPSDAARALAALLDLHRRGVARAFADLVAVVPTSAAPAELERWASDCPDNPQWFSALLPPAQGPETGWASRGLELLVSLGLCQPAGGGFSLAGAALAVGDRMILVDTLYSVDVAQLDAAGELTLAHVVAVQAGINDLLQLEFLSDGVSFTSDAPAAFLLQLDDILERGGAVLSAQQGSVAQPSTPAPAGTDAATCHHCAQPLVPTARFCSHCGRPVGEPLPPPPSA